MATPNITLTATLDDLSGAAAGSLALAAKLRITLCGFGPALPRIAGTAMIAKAGPTSYFSTGSALSIPLWGNDQITPAGTFYTIEILDGEDNVVQCAAYLFTGAITIDLSQATPLPFIPPATPQFSAFINAPVEQEAGGAVDGTNVDFTFNAPSSPAPVIAVFVGGIFQTIADYSTNYAGSGIWNLVFADAPVDGPVMVLLFSSATATAYIPVAFSTTPVFAGNGYPGIICFDMTLTGNVTSSTLAGIGTGQFVQFFIQQYGVGSRTFAWPANVENPPVINPAASATTTALFVMRSDGNLYPVSG
jgi:hypothetical protein